MSQSPVNLASPSARAVIKELKRGECLTSAQIQEHVDVSKPLINAILNELHARKMIHVGDWRFSLTGVPSKMYAWGDDADKRLPVKAQKPKKELLDDEDLPWPRCDVAASWIKR